MDDPLASSRHHHRLSCQPASYCTNEMEFRLLTGQPYNQLDVFKNLCKLSCISDSLAKSQKTSILRFLLEEQSLLRVQAENFM